MKRALLLVDIQNDFLPGGALAVKGGDEILPLVNQLVNKKFDLIVATQDWHPQDHGSFAPAHGKHPGEVIDLFGLQQILWPVHCVEGSWGAEFGPWDHRKVQKIFHKGTDQNIDSYSTFFDNGHRHKTGLAAFLREKGIAAIYVAGLATDYCVLYSVRDAIHLGFETYVIIDACRGVDLHPGDIERGIEEMRALGAHLISSREVP